ncbi:hypothetical protein SUDANB171_03827 [Streptomyces sp. enrichment culture]|uniref:hypothetical protein n=1 Tax=Streptomyces sp. enrichment culture TaxID=1795815 RepID=UPI003F55F977
MGSAQDSGWGAHGSQDPYRTQNPYQQPTMPPGWPGAPTPVPPPPGKGRKAALLGVAGVVVAALAVTVGVVLTRDGGADGDGDGGAAAAEEEQTPRTPSPQDPRRPVEESEEPLPVVADDWQVVLSDRWHTAFDVPPDWRGPSRDSSFRWETWEPEDPDVPDYAFSLTDVSAVIDTECGQPGHRLVAGTRGAQGATDTADAAEIIAGNLLWANYDQTRSASFDVGEPEPFETEHGITGHIVRATVTDVPDGIPERDCPVTDGMSIAVSYLSPNSDLVGWGLVADTGHDGEVDPDVIESVLSSIRHYTR